MTTEELVRQTASQYGVPPDLAVAVAKQESGLNQSARGAAGEVGVFQLMPRTASGLNVNPYDLNQNVQGGITYLKQMYDRFGDWSTALLAYNAGPTAVATGKVPPSSQSYLSSVMARFNLATPTEQIWSGEGLPAQGLQEASMLSPALTLMLIAGIVGIGLLIAGKD